MFYFDPIRFFRSDLSFFWNKPSSLRFDLFKLMNKQSSICIDLSFVWNMQSSLRFDHSYIWNKQRSLRFASIFLNGVWHEIFDFRFFSLISVPQAQSCSRNEGSLNRGLDRCRGLGLGVPFFSDTCSKLEIDAAFRISHKLGHGLAVKTCKTVKYYQYNFISYSLHITLRLYYSLHILALWQHQLITLAV